MNNEPDGTSDKQFESDLQAVCCHEAGHYECSRAFGIPSVMQVVISDAGDIREGWCCNDHEGPKFEDAVISWGGTVGEYLTGHIWRHGPPKSLFPLDEKFIERWHDEMLFYRHKLSDSDRNGIIGLYENTLESCRHCFRVLSRRLPELREDAAMLAARTRAARVANLAAARKFEEANKTASKWAAQSHKLSTAERARHLENYLRDMPADAPERLKFTPMLDSLRRGEEPPVE